MGKLMTRTFGRLTLIAREGKTSLVSCSCGTACKRVRSNDLFQGKINSCGCARSEHARGPLKQRNRTHGRTNTTEYRIWVDMRRRCTKSKRPDFHRYGGRGIGVSEEWYRNFETFLADMGERPEGTSLERRDNDGNYCKDNCYWATKEEQSRNTRQNRRIMVRGEEMIVADAARRYGMTKNCLLLRLKRGMSPDDAIANPPSRTVRPRRRK